MKVWLSEERTNTLVWLSRRKFFLLEVGKFRCTQKSKVSEAMPR